MSIVEKAQIVEFIQMQNVNFAEDNIPDIVITLVENRIKSRIRMHGFDPEIEGTDYSIWSATFFYILEVLQMNAKVLMFTGDVARDRVGSTEVDFQRWQPMFFFATGMAEKFYALLPHETYRMIAEQFFQAWRIYKTNNICKIVSGHMNNDGSIEELVGSEESVTFREYFELVKTYVSQPPQDT